MFFKEPLTEWFFVESKMVLLWHHCEEPFKHLYFEECWGALGTDGEARVSLDGV